MGRIAVAPTAEPSGSGYLQSTLPRRGRDSIVSPALMPDVFWIGFAVFAFSVFVGFVASARSRDTRTLTGVAIGAFLGLMAAFPLLALGLANS